jgi:hypothetical protein
MIFGRVMLFSSLLGSGCWLALNETREVNLESYTIQHDSPIRPGHEGGCIASVRSGRHRHYEYQGRKIGGFELERLIQPDDEGRAAFRLQRAGLSLMYVAAISYLGVVASLLPSAISGSMSVSSSERIAASAFGVNFALSLASGIPMTIAGDERVRRVVDDFNARTKCPE